MAATARTATVTCGPESLSSVELVCQSVADIRDLYGDTLNIGSGTNAFVKGTQVSEDYIVKAGETLVFSRPVGSKG
jgi:hypothetical protein